MHLKRISTAFLLFLSSAAADDKVIIASQYGKAFLQRSFEFAGGPSTNSEPICSGWMPAVTVSTGSLGASDLLVNLSAYTRGGFFAWLNIGGGTEPRTGMKATVSARVLLNSTSTDTTVPTSALAWGPVELASASEYHEAPGVPQGTQRNSVREGPGVLTFVKRNLGAGNQTLQAQFRLCVSSSGQNASTNVEAIVERISMTVQQVRAEVQ